MVVFERPFGSRKQEGINSYMIKVLMLHDTSVVNRRNQDMCLRKRGYEDVSKEYLRVLGFGNQHLYWIVIELCDEKYDVPCTPESSLILITCSVLVGVLLSQIPCMCET